MVAFLLQPSDVEPPFAAASTNRPVVGALRGQTRPTRRMTAARALAQAGLLLQVGLVWVLIAVPLMSFLVRTRGGN